MKYDEYLAAGYPIGSGVVGGACRHLVKDRMERTGMRWLPSGRQAMLDLRATYLNGEWNAFWNFHVTQENERLYGKYGRLGEVNPVVTPFSRRRRSSSVIFITPEEPLGTRQTMCCTDYHDTDTEAWVQSLVHAPIATSLATSLDKVRAKAGLPYLFDSRLSEPPLATRSHRPTHPGGVEAPCGLLYACHPRLVNVSIDLEAESAAPARRGHLGCRGLDRPDGCPGRRTDGHDPQVSGLRGDTPPDLGANR